MRILVVEDTEDVGEAILARLRRLGHDVDWEATGPGADDRLAVQAYDLVVLDVMLPGGTDGFEVLRNLRARKDRTPVLMLTARSEVDDRVGALDLGADDYLVKPFDYRELEARARALLRRHAASATNELVLGDVSMDRHARTVRVAGEPVALTRRELTLLEILMAQPGRIFPKEDLVGQLFGLDDAAAPDNAVEQYVARLRRKLGAAERAEIRTLHGLGYQMVGR